MGRHQEQTSRQTETTKRRRQHVYRRYYHRLEDQAPQEAETAVEKPVTRKRSNAVGPEERPSLEEILSPDWYIGLRDGPRGFHQYNNVFVGTRKDLTYTSDLDHLDQIEESAQRKKLDLDAFFVQITELHEAMLNDPGNQDKKAEGEKFYDTCRKQMTISEGLYARLMAAVAERKKTVQTEAKLLKRNSIRTRLQALKKDSPMMQLIRRVKAMESGADLESSGVRTTKTIDFMDLIPEDAQDQWEATTEMMEGIEETTEGGDQVKSFLEGIRSGSVKKEDDDLGDLKEKITGGIGTVKDIAETIRNVVDVVRNFSKMSAENKEEMLANLISDGIKTALDASQYIVELIKDVPLLGGIIGLIKNAITFFQKGFEIYHAEKRKKAMKAARRRLKEKMLKRREKYAGDQDLRDLNLYSQVERDGNGAAHMTRAQKEQDKREYGRERRGMDGQSGGENRDTMRQNAARRREDPEAKKAYYKAKADESQAQYDEMKEAAYRNKNMITAAIVDIVQEGISVVENIASFIPGVGTVVQAGAKAVNTGIGQGRKGFSRIHSAWKELRNNPRSEKNKEKFRTKYAENIYSSLADVSQFVNDEGTLTIDDTKLDEVKRIEDSYNFAETLLGGAGANMPELINSESKEELLDNMSKMFARGD